MTQYRYLLFFVMIALMFVCSSCETLYSLNGLFGQTGYGKKEKPVIISSPEEFFLKSDQLFREGRYWRALRETRRIYQEASDPIVEEEALFRVILIIAYGDNPNRSYEEARRVGRGFLESYPESKRKAEVETLLLLIKDIRRGKAEIETLKGYNSIQDEKVQRLEEDIRKIKEIDLQLEEQKKELE